MIPITRPAFGREEEEAVVSVLRSGWVTQGPRVAEFERAFAAYVGNREAVAVSSCTTALHLLLHALGVGQGDEVVAPSLSFIATANAIAHAGATPVFADVDLATSNLDPASVEAALGPKTRAIMLVHQAGLPADLESFRALAARVRLPLVEDAACAIGSRLGGSLVGADSPMAAFSFHPRKLLTTGDGGMIVTGDPALARRLRSLRHHGMSVSDLERHRARGVVIESYGEIGFNYRMTDLQAALGLVQLGKIEDFVARRQMLAERYNKAFAGHQALAIPHVPRGVAFNYQTYQLRLLPGARVDRDGLMRALHARDISSRRGIMAAHLEPAYRHLALRVPLPNTEEAARTSLVLPLFHDLQPGDQDQVIDAVLTAL